MTGDMLMESEQRIPKLIAKRKIDEYFYALKSLKINANATKISFLGYSSDSNHKIFVYDIERDVCQNMELEINLKIENHFWDESDGRLLTLEWKNISFSENIHSSSSNSTSRASSPMPLLNINEEEMKISSNTGVISCFIAPDGEILLQEMFASELKFIGVHIPNFMFVSETEGNATVVRKRIRDFIGIDNIDDDTRMNLFNFSYFLSVGNFDEAFRSVQNIKSSSVWENMAKMCVKTRRLDVAEICIANLSSARGESATVASSLFYDQNGNDAKQNDKAFKVYIYCIF